MWDGLSTFPGILKLLVTLVKVRLLTSIQRDKEKRVRRIGTPCSPSVFPTMTPDPKIKFFAKSCGILDVNKNVFTTFCHQFSYLAIIISFYMNQESEVIQIIYKTVKFGGVGNSLSGDYKGR